MSGTKDGTKGGKGDKAAAVIQAELESKYKSAKSTGSIDVHSYRLTEMPEALFTLPELRRLMAHDNQITALPSQIGLLTALNVLYVQSNAIEEISPQIGLLLNLMTLALHDNRLQYLPKELGRCSELQVLTLSKNMLREVPLSIGACKKLKTLELKDNPGLSIPPKYIVRQGPSKCAEYLVCFGAAMDGEHKLDLSQRKLTSFPPEVTWLGRALRSLDLSSNISIGTLPYIVCELSGLTALTVDSSKVWGRITQGLGFLTALTHLSLASNEIVSVPIGLGYATGLEKLVLEKNWTLRLPPREIQALGYPANWEFMKRLARAEETSSLDLSEQRLVSIDFLQVAVASTKIAYLEELPEAGGPWTHLVLLDLSANKLQTLSEVIGELTSLRTLLVSGNQLGDMPQSMTRLTDLRQLRLNGNCFSKFPGIICFADSGGKVQHRSDVGFDVSSIGMDQVMISEAWGPGAPQPSLTDLDLSRNNLGYIYKSLIAMTQLRSLNMSHNKLTKLPPDFKDLSGLTELDLSANEIVACPFDLWDCPKLKRLLMGSNRLTELPFHIGRLTILEELDISNNKITALPLEIGRLKNLTKPRFKGNNFQGVPANLQKGGDAAILSFWRAMVDSKQSRVFDLSSTGMVDLPDQLGEMTWLTELNLSHNQLIRLSPGVANLQLVRSLNISHNRIGLLPPEIGRMCELRSLDIRGNNIRQLPLELGFCTLLRELLYDEGIMTMPSKFIFDLGINALGIYLRRMHEANSKSRLALTGMGLVSIPREVLAMQFLVDLSLDKNKIEDLERDVVLFDDLVSLSCSMNAIQNMDFLIGDVRRAPWDKQRLSLLTSLRIRGNQIKIIPPEITRLKALQLLMMDGNQIEELPPEVGLLPHLEICTVAKNRIATIPHTLSRLLELRVLEIQGNKIKALPFGLGNVIDLTKFVYDDNPIREPPVEVTSRGAEVTLRFLERCYASISSNEMDATSFGFYIIPSEFCKMDNLLSLRLPDNRISLVRPDLTTLTRLEILDLSENQLKDFPTVLCDLTLLYDLNLSHNHFARIPLSLGRLTLLRKLGLEGLRLIQPAPEVAMLPAPQVVGYLRKYWKIEAGLESNLDIRSIGLSALPREVAVLGILLEELRLDRNRIMDLTFEIGHLWRLHTLSASNNQLVSLPFELNHLTNLTLLDVKHNNIAALPNIPGLRMLTMLDASHNNLTGIPLNIKNWTSLKTLNLHHNILINLPSAIGDLYKLVDMDVSSNRLNALPKAFAKLTRLGTLNAKHNSMTRVPNELALMTGLTSLLIAGNRILALPPAMGYCTNISQLELSLSHLLAPPAETHGGGVHSMFSYLRALHDAQFEQRLVLAGWELAAFPLDGYYLTGLTYLNLQHNQLRVIPHALGAYRHLINLQLDHNRIETIPEQIGKLHASLTELSCSHNVLQRITSGIFQLTSLIRLTLARNKIKALPETLSKLTMLRFLDLDHNQIQAIPDSLAILSRLRDLYFEGNPIAYVSPESFINCKGLRLLKVQSEWLDDNKAWRKDTSMFKMIAGSGVTFPPTEVLMLGSEALWKYMVLVAKSKQSETLDLSRVNFWMLELEQQYSRLRTWPIDLSTYEHLTRLNLAGNLMTTLPESVRNLTNLTELDLEQNRLKTLPNGLSHCSALETIMLLRNPDLCSPPKEVTTKGSAAVLHYLKCINMGLTKDKVVFEGSSYLRVPLEIVSLGNVTSMSLARNAIEILPAEIMALTSLQHLRLDDNRLAMLPDEISVLTRLCALSCERNLLVSVPDKITRLVNLVDVRLNGNFLGDAPPEESPHPNPHNWLDYPLCVLSTPWMALEFVCEVTRGRREGHINLSDFELLSVPKTILYVDRPERWGRGGIDRYMQVAAQEQQRLHKKELKAIKDHERRLMRETLGLDPDEESDPEQDDPVWDPLLDFVEDAIIENQSGTAIRRRDRLRTLEQIYESFRGWYAYALGYNSKAEMLKNRKEDRDVGLMPSEEVVYLFLVARFGPPEIEAPCRWCIELGKGCTELGSSAGRLRRHKGQHQSARTGWYHLKVRATHGQHAHWSDEDTEDAKSATTVDSSAQAELNEQRLFGKVKGVDDMSSSSGEEDFEDGDETGSRKGRHRQPPEEEDSDTETGEGTLTSILNGGAFPFVRSLDLHNNLITVLPAEIKKLRRLEVLRISHNLLSMVPGEMGKMTALIALNLSGNRIVDFPQEMSSLRNLTNLDICRNEFKVLPDCLENYTGLKILHAEHNKMRTISAALGGCRQLEQLWMSDNFLTSIHPLVGQLQRLQTLNLETTPPRAGNNQITSVAAHIGSCAALTALALHGNGIARVPPALKKLKYLKRLELDNNTIVDVPEALMFLHKLSSLSFNDNTVKVMDPAVCKAEALTTLLFQNNQIERMPDEIRLLSNLTELRLDGNQLVEVSAQISALDTLCLLMLSRNNLTKLPNSIKGLSSLTKLSVDSNKLRTLPDSFGQLYNLERLWADDNLLQVLPESFGSLSALTELHLDRNHLYHLCDSFSELTQLLELFLHENSFGHVQHGDLDEVVGGPYGVPPAVCELHSLRVLSLAKCDLDNSMLPQGLTRLSNLTELWLQENLFEELPAQVCNLPKLRYCLMDVDMDAIGPTSAHFGQAAFPEEESVGGGASMQSNKKLHSRKEMMGKLLGQK